MVDVHEADDRELRAHVDAFKAALQSKHQEVAPPALEHVLLALDGSNQDATSAALAAAVAKHAGAAVHVLSAPRDEDDGAPDAAEQKAAELLQDGVTAQAVPASAAQRRGRAWDRILHAVERTRAGLVVLCAPFQDDFGALGPASAGTNLDLLMARSPVPLLVVRAPQEAPAECLNKIVLPIVVRSREQPKAAGWALRLVADGGRIRIVAVDQELMARAGDRLEHGVDYDELDEETLAGLREPETAGLIGALQRSCAPAGIGCRVSVRSGGLVEALLALEVDRPRVYVVPSPRDPRQEAFHRVQALVRASPWPLLIV